MNSYVMGIDGGSSKTHLALFESDGTLVDFRLGGPLNHEVLQGYDEFEKELGQMISGALRVNRIALEQVGYAVIGMAGVDTRRQHQIISEIIQKQGLRSFTLCNDAYLGVFAGSPSGAGICAINGSGCTIAGINESGSMLQIGGMGDVTGDVGGGSVLGARVVSAVYGSLFRMAKPTLLTELLFKKLGIASKYDLTEQLSAMVEQGFKVSACNSLLFEAAGMSDDVATEILQEVAINYVNGVLCMAEELAFEKSQPLDIVLAGSVFAKAEHPLLFNTMKNQLGETLAGYRIRCALLDKPPVAGAVIWALKMLDSGGDYFERVLAEL